MMRLLVTGATGFLGGHFTRAALAAGHEILAVSRRPAPALEAAGARVLLRDVRALTAADVAGSLDAVVHFATATSGDERTVRAVAVDGTLAAWRLARDAGASRLVHVSSMSVYAAGRAGALEPHPERRGAYAGAKVLAERALASAAEEDPGAVDVVVVRPGVVFGPEMGSALAGTAVVLPLGLGVVTGPAGGGVPVLHVGDLTRGVLALLGTPVAGAGLRAFDVHAGPPPARRAILAEYRRLTGQPLRTLAIPKALAVGGGWLAERALALGGRRAGLRYTMSRVYDFDPAARPHEPFWASVGIAPASSLARCIADGVTAARDGVPADGGVRPRRVATEMLALVDRTRARHELDVVLIGAGRIVGEMHVPALRALAPGRVRAVVDRDPVLAERVAAHFPGAQAVTQVDGLADAVVRGACGVVATPGATHHDVARTLLDRGASLLVEKPVVLTAEELGDLQAAAAERAAPVTVVHNYRLRPNALRLWRFLAAHDVGALVRARVDFHTGRIATEPARWLRDEKGSRALVLEVGIHFLDLVCVLAGEITALRDLRVTDGDGGRTTVAVEGAADTSGGARLDFTLDASGVARRTQVVFEFERCTCVLDFFPEGFRVLPLRATPLDDLAADLRRFGGFARGVLASVSARMPERARPHLLLYREHERRAAGGEAGAFALDAVAATMRSLFRICDAVYGTR